MLKPRLPLPLLFLCLSMMSYIIVLRPNGGCAALLTCILIATAAVVAEDDVRCLKGVKDSLSDPNHSLNWNLGNRTSGSFCSFNGITCWDAHENRVLAINLSSKSLSGNIPSALQYCTATNNLDLSGNFITGEIPAKLCTWLPYLVTLDLSGNQLTGSIPPDLSNCHFLNTLILSGNRLSGQIPSSFYQLSRLKHLDLSNNQLSGAIPASLGAFDASVFSGNDDLCGRPFPSCDGASLSTSSVLIIVAAGVFGAATSLLLSFAALRWCFK